MSLCAFDQNDSGNISFGLITDQKQKVFLKYAGARTVNHDGEPTQTIERLRKATKAYDDLRHPVLVKLIDQCDTPSGFAALFEWADGDCLHAHWNFARYPKYQHPQCPSYRLRNLPINLRLDTLHQIFEFHEYVAQKGYVAIDFYDGCIMYDFATDRLTICDVDFYEKAPFQWDGPPALYYVACRAVSPEREARYQSIGEFIEEWEAAGGWVVDPVAKLPKMAVIRMAIAGKRHR
mgnify:CR=1 FL=1